MNDPGIVLRARSSASALGIDRAVAYAIAGRAWSAVAGPLTLVLIGTSLSATAQGFYYTFFSVVALNTFLELGLSHVLLVSASHEKARLAWTPGGLLLGDDAARARLAALLRNALWWYAGVALLFVALMIPAGFAFFADHQAASAVQWKLPWLVLVLATGAVLVLTPVWAILEGCGLVREIGRVRLWAQIAGTLGLWAALLGGAGLFSTAVLSLTNVAFGVAWFSRERRAVLLDLLRQHTAIRGVSLLRELWPMQWRIAVSWGCGWFLTQMMNPVVFRYHGAEAAGRLGMTLALTQALVPVGAAWLSTKAPRFGELVVHRRFADLDEVFRTSLVSSTAIMATGAFALSALVYGAATQGLEAARRVVDPLPFALLALVPVLSHVIGAQAQYLRAHKSEPFVVVYVALAIAMGACAVLVVPRAGTLAIAITWLAATAVAGLAFGTWVFVRKRRAWHGRAFS